MTTPAKRRIFETPGVLPVSHFATTSVQPSDLSIVAQTGDAFEALNFYIHDGANTLRLEIEGSLCANNAERIQQAWQTASSCIADCMVVVNIRRLTNIDCCGRALLQAWNRAGVRIVGKSPLTSTLIASILGERSAGAQAEKCGNVPRFWAYTLRLIPFVALIASPRMMAASLDPATLTAWQEYVGTANLRMEERLLPGKDFLWVDEAPDRARKVRTGNVVVSSVDSRSPRKVPSGLIHDWIGAVFIPDAKLSDVREVVHDYARYKEFYKPTVVDSKVVPGTKPVDRFSMLLLNRSLLLRTAFETDYESCYVSLDDRRGYSVARTTRVQEVEEYGTSRQFLLHEGQGTGIIWELFSIARFFERDGGVYIELEAIGLSRDIPPSIRWVVEPIVRRVSRGSLTTSLRQTAEAVRLRVRLAERAISKDTVVAAESH